MKILALDLGKYKTVGCDYERGELRRLFRSRPAFDATLSGLRAPSPCFCRLPPASCLLLFKVRGIERPAPPCGLIARQ